MGMKRDDQEGAIYLLFFASESPKAYLVGRDRIVYGKDLFWLPKSQVALNRESRDKEGNRWGYFDIPNWLAEKCGLDSSLDGEDDEGGDVIDGRDHM
jgi:hypothetical protein